MNTCIAAKKMTFRSQAMQNNENGYLTASRRQKRHCMKMQYYASSIRIFFQNFCSTSGVPFIMLYMLYSFENGPLEPKQCKILQFRYKCITYRQSILSNITGQRETQFDKVTRQLRLQESLQQQRDLHSVQSWALLSL